MGLFNRSLGTWLGSLVSRKASLARTSPRVRTKKLRLGFDVLEERATPATFAVDNAGDFPLFSMHTGTTLRDAIFAAEIFPGPDLIVFDPSLAGQDIVLTLSGTTPGFGDSAFSIGSDITINGAALGAGRGITRDTLAGNFRLFLLQNINANLKLQDTTLKFGNAGATDEGGAIFVNQGSLGLNTVTFDSNRARNGGAIAQNGGGVTMQSVRFNNNSATANGGAYDWIGGSNSSINPQPIFTNNTATLNGGGWHTLGVNGSFVFTAASINNRANNGGLASFEIGTVTVLNSTVTSNDADSNGGGIHAMATTLTITNSTISQNTAASSGGGIVVNGGSLLLQSGSVVANNTAAGSGGGIQAVNTSIRVNASTIRDNRANTGNGGGISLAPSAGAIVENGSVIRGNFGVFGGGIYLGDSTNSLSVSDSTLGGGTAALGNTSTFSGAGIAIDGGNATVTNTLFQNNASGTNGGGIRLIAGTLDITGSTFLSNVGDSNLDGNGVGGALTLFSGTATVSNSTFGGLGAGSGNRAQSGGAIANNGGTLTLSDSSVLGNQARGNGGGLDVNSSNATTILRATIAGNSADSDNNFNGDGGGVFYGGTGPLSITETTLGGLLTSDGNLANNGGGIAQTGGTLNVFASALANNVAQTYGGGFTISAGTGFITNSTLANNTAFNGGGVNFSGGSLRLTNDTLAFNTGGGVFRPVLGGTFNAANTIFSDNTLFDFAGTINSLGNNLFGSGTSLSGNVASDLVNRPAALAALANNGGTTPTIAIQLGSDAINAGSNAQAVDPAAGSVALVNDQRGVGFPRYFAAIVDIGAFELVDTTAPTVTITPMPNVLFTNAGSTTFEFVFSEPVKGFTAADVIVNGIKGLFTAVNTTTYTLIVIPNADGLVTATSPFNAAQDYVGNASIANSGSVTFDRVAPTVAISAPSPLATNTGPVVFTISYTDLNFNASTLGISDITLNTTGTATGNISVSGGSGATRFVTISGITGNGTIGISLAANTANDRAGNLAPAAGPSTTFLVDNIAPTVTIGPPSVPITSGGPVSFIVTYADANFNASTLTAGNVTLNSTGTATGTISVSAGSGTSRTVTISGITGNGTLGISLAANTANDRGGNQAPAAGPSATFIVDNTAPTLTITPNSGITNASPIVFTFQFSETVTGFDAGDVNLTNGTAGTFTAVDGDTYTLAVTPLADGTVTTSVAAGVAVDQANLPNTAASASVTSDRTGPTITITGPSLPSTITGPVFFTVTYADPIFNASTLTAANVIKNLTGTANGTVVVTGTGTTRTVTIQDVYGNGTIGISLPPGTASDTAGNLSLAAGPSATFSVSGNRILHLSQPALPKYIVPGTLFTDFIDYSNTGNQISPNAVIHVNLPAYATFVASQSTAGWVNAGGGQYTFSFGNLAPGASGRLKFAVTFAKSTPPGTAFSFVAGIRDTLSGSTDVITSTVSSIVVDPLRKRWDRCC